MKKQTNKQYSSIVRHTVLCILAVCMAVLLIYLLFYDDSQHVQTTYAISILLCILLFLTSVILAGSVYTSSTSLFQRPDLSEYIRHVVASVVKNLKDF